MRKFFILWIICLSGWVEGKSRPLKNPPPLMPENDPAPYSLASSPGGIDRGPESYAALRAREGESSFSTRNTATRLSILSGITTTAQDVNYQKLNHNLYFGAASETHFHYGSLEIEGYYGTASVDFSQSSNLLNRSGELRQYGALVNLNGELPLYLHPFTLVPKVGIGYGFMDVSTSQNITLANTNAGLSPGVGQLLHGPFAIAGISLEPFRLFVLSFDYATSLAVAGKISGGINPVNLSFGSSTGKYERIRAVAQIRLGKSFLLGAQFIQRVSSLELPIGSNPSGRLFPTQRHYLGMLSFEW